MKGYITDDRGQVGIGTLIVFIALVLVAAIAAGVLINTAGFLQTQAEETGEDSTDQVADNINVIGEVGVYDSQSTGTNDIDQVRFTVQRSAGSSEIDLTGLSIQYVGDNGFAQLVHGADVSSGDPGYYVEVVTAESTGDAVITADGDRYDIVIPVGTDPSPGSDASGSNVDNIATNDELSNLAEGERAELEITTDAGATRNVVISAPDTFVDLSQGDTVTL